MQTSVSWRTRIRANDTKVAPKREIPQVFVAGAVSGGRPQNGLAGWLAGLAGWAGWLAGWLGLQKAAGSVPEDSVPFGRGPPGCGAAANKISPWTRAVTVAEDAEAWSS